MGTMSEIAEIEDQLTDNFESIIISFEKSILLSKDADNTFSADLFSRSLIVSVADIVERYRQEVCMITRQRYTVDINQLPEWLWNIRAASNWVRHHSEWFAKFWDSIRNQIASNKLGDGGAFFSQHIDDLCFKDYEKKNIKAVLGLLSTENVEELFIYGNGSALTIATNLELLDFEKAYSNFRAALKLI